LRASGVVLRGTAKLRLVLCVAWLLSAVSPVAAEPVEPLSGSLADEPSEEIEAVTATAAAESADAGAAPAAAGDRKAESALSVRFEAALRLVGSADSERQRQAARDLEALAAEAPQSELAPEALFEAGQLFEEHLADPEAARRCYRALVRRYPQSRLLRRASQRLRQLDTALRSGAPALVTFQQILRTTGEASAERRARLLTLLAESPDFALADQALFLVADTSLRLGDEAAAASQFASLYQRFPRSLWSAQGHRAQAEAELRARRIESARAHYLALQAYPEAPWPLIVGDGLRACKSAARRQLAAIGAWAFLLLGAAASLWRSRKVLWPAPFEVWYYVPLSTFLSAVALWAQGGALALPIGVLGLGGTAMAWLSAAAARRLVAQPQGSRAQAWARLLVGLALRVVAVLALCFLVIYHFSLVELVAETLRNGPDAE
jgi:hypothetical protein